MNEVIQTILQRRSIRRYEPRQVEAEKIDLLLQAAMAAPNACNSQPWEFVVVTNEEILTELRSGLQFARYKAPLAIVVCANVSIANNSTARHFWVQDCSAATENVLIAATSLGLGTVWIGVYPLPGVIETVSRITNLPENVTPLCVIYVGYSAEEKPARTQYDAHRIHWQQYEPRKRRAKQKNAKHL